MDSHSYSSLELLLLESEDISSTLSASLECDLSMGVVQCDDGMPLIMVLWTSALGCHVSVVELVENGPLCGL